MNPQPETARPSAGPTAVVVAVPARDEEEVLADCLASVARANRHLRRVETGVQVHVVVALDRCTDGSAGIAAAAGAALVHLAEGRVGVSRAAAVRRGLDLAGRAGHLPERVWVACTDADTVVPATWLSRQVAFARAGAVMTVGTVEPDDMAGASLLSEWHARHDLREGHHHVHGANLGLRGDVYLAAGGFGDLTADEDVDLVRRVQTLGRWVATDTLRVRTSARRVSRVTAGFAGYLRRLEANTA